VRRCRSSRSIWPRRDRALPRVSDERSRLDPHRYASYPAGTEDVRKYSSPKRSNGAARAGGGRGTGVSPPPFLRGRRRSCERHRTGSHTRSCRRGRGLLGRSNQGSRRGGRQTSPAARGDDEDHHRTQKQAADATDATKVALPSGHGLEELTSTRRSVEYPYRETRQMAERWCLLYFHTFLHFLYDHCMEVKPADWTFKSRFFSCSLLCLLW